MNKSTLTCSCAAVSFLLVSTGLAAASDDQWKLMDVATNINTEYHEAFSVMTSDGLNLYFSSTRPSKHQDANTEDHWMAKKDGGDTTYDIYVSKRESLTAEWGEPTLLPDTINDKASDHSPSLSEDGHYLFFASDRPGGCGSLDLYASYRTDVNDDQSWQAAKNLGCAEDGGPNGAAFDSCPIVKDGTIYFTSSTSSDLATLEFKRTLFNSSAMTAGEGTILSNSTPYVDAHFDPHHGLVWGIYPEGGVGGSDLWQFQNAHSESDPANFANLVAFGAPINTKFEEHMPSATADGKFLAFASDRPGGAGGMDIYLAEKN